MSRAAPVDQFGFDFGAPAPAGTPGDALAARLVVEGLVPNHFVLDLNRGLSTPQNMALPYPWSLPSRLFRHSIAFIRGDRRSDGRCAILVRHPLLVDHPFVRQVAARLRQEPGWEERDEFDRDFGALPRWWHAVDLMTAAHWRDLLATRRFTDDASIARAVTFALLCRGPVAKGGFDTRDARQVLVAIGAEEPADWSDAALHGGMLIPRHIDEHHHRTGKVTRDEWAADLGDDGTAAAWMLVHGLEDGWFVRKPAQLVLSAKGLRRRGLDREGGSDADRGKDAHALRG